MSQAKINWRPPSDSAPVDVSLRDTCRSRNWKPSELEAVRALPVLAQIGAHRVLAGSWHCLATGTSPEARYFYYFK